MYCRSISLVVLVLVHLRSEIKTIQNILIQSFSYCQYIWDYKAPPRTIVTLDFGSKLTFFEIAANVEREHNTSHMPVLPVH